MIDKHIRKIGTKNDFEGKLKKDLLEHNQNGQNDRNLS